MMNKIQISEHLMFAPYQYNWIEEDGIKHEWSLISIQLDRTLIRLTDYHKYVGAVNGSEYAYYIDNDSVRRVCNFLTYALFKHYGRYKVKRITDIPFQSAVDYINEYSKTKSSMGNYPSMQSVEKERYAICHFMKNLKEKRSDYDEHYYVRKVLVETTSTNKLKGKKRSRAVWEYEIPAKYLGDSSYGLLRDIPQKAIPILLRAVKREEPELVLAVLLQLCAGIREGEIVNIRRANSIYPNGIRYVKENGKFTSFEVDLNKEYVLRSDGKKTGKIKIKRTQSIYPIFLEVIQEAYEEHLKMIHEKYLEPEAPLFVNSSINAKTGKRMAISKQSYCKKIVNIMREIVLPELLRSDDIELKVFGMMLNESNWGLHAFRHWFTVQLVLNGEDINGIAFWRGDSSLETALTYLQNKGEIMRQYEKASEEVGNDIINAINKEDFYGL
ncbi:MULTISPECIES: site-specific integrase [Paenibacillus]|uniref:site-specific integrase n=1 Tax=Paenibacillus TaxID=44249 RepID=UPI0009546EE8|nr:MULTISPECIES: site-specific integrase [Paenibacillus]MEC0246358.1 site-specific integrase [Paenibacillus chitinolyticus]QID16037.1 site-specific integrase [Paenibacillus sp. RUD330]SIR69279.1 hypothetical protein SAMN05880555_4756 [Paenibacillus sp. RU4X]SIR76596.1 hypothetical protein SAMN05880570_4758 [Paenibacillus sp. RU4T]